MLTIREPRIFERKPYFVFGSDCTFQGDDEGPGWSGADQEFNRWWGEVTHIKGDLTPGFMYRLHKDRPEAPYDVYACFAVNETHARRPLHSEYVTLQLEKGALG